MKEIESRRGESQDDSAKTESEDVLEESSEIDQIQPDGYIDSSDTKHAHDTSANEMKEKVEKLLVIFSKM